MNKKINKKIRVILWNMNYVLDSVSPNVGDRALLTSIISAIKENCSDFEIIIFASDPNVVRQEYNVYGVRYRFNNLKEILSELWHCDIFVFAGGEVVVDRGSTLYTPFMMHAALIAKLFRKKIIGYGIGIAEKNEITYFSKFLTRLVFSKSTVIVRDIISKESLLAICKPKIIHCTADPVLNLKPISKEEVEYFLETIGIIKNGKPLVAIVPRQPLMPLNKFSDRICNIIPIKIREKMKLTPKNFGAKIAEFKKNIAKISDYLVEKYDAKILFIPMFSGFMSYNDDVMCKDIIEKMRWNSKAKIISSDLTAGAFKALFGSMDLVIGFPLHSIIFATSMGVPVISFSYESKVERYMKRLKFEKYNFDIKDINHEIDFDRVIDTIDYIMSNRESIRKQLINNIMELKHIEGENVRLFLHNISRK
ncbi:MAG: polysaccharide pyruvyl transferase family protein [Firmicutes bacterium]|nr:polysaccharide pyruvyl transferase family protein [Bacillota bacterium]